MSRFALSCLAATLAVSTPLIVKAEEVRPQAEEVSLDPARQAAATTTVDYIFPSGTYAKIMKGTLDSVLKMTMGTLDDMPIKELAGIGGLSEDQLKELGEGTLAEVLAIYDPAYKQRMELGMTAMMGEMTRMMSSFEPAMREGLSQAYAKRFTAEQLGELNRFFATPTGRAYAADSMLLFMDPAVMDKMQKMMPEMMKQMPAMIQAMDAATAHLPKARSYKDLTKAERAKLAKLLGVTEAQLAKQNR